MAVEAFDLLFGFSLSFLVTIVFIVAKRINHFLRSFASETVLTHEYEWSVTATQRDASIISHVGLVWTLLAPKVCVHTTAKSNA